MYNQKLGYQLRPRRPLYDWLCHLVTFIYNQKRWPNDQANHIVAFLASADIKVFGHTYLPIYNAASDWPRTFFTPRVFLFSISLLFKQMLLLVYRTQYCKLNLNFHFENSAPQFFITFTKG